jgi:hypothetical protein
MRQAQQERAKQSDMMQQSLESLRVDIGQLLQEMIMDDDNQHKKLKQVIVTLFRIQLHECYAAACDAVGEPCGFEMRADGTCAVQVLEEMISLKAAAHDSKSEVESLRRAKFRTPIQLLFPDQFDGGTMVTSVKVRKTRARVIKTYCEVGFF